MNSKEIKALGLPSINLKGKDFLHVVPEEEALEIMIQWKLGRAEREFVSPVDRFSLEDGQLKIKNRTSEFIWTYPIKEVKAAYIIPMGAV